MKIKKSWKKEILNDFMEAISEGEPLGKYTESDSYLEGHVGKNDKWYEYAVYRTYEDYDAGVPEFTVGLFPDGKAAEWLDSEKEPLGQFKFRLVPS